MDGSSCKGVSENRAFLVMGPSKLGASGSLGRRLVLLSPWRAFSFSTPASTVSLPRLPSTLEDFSTNSDALSRISKRVDLRRLTPVSSFSDSLRSSPSKAPKVQSRSSACSLSCISCSCALVLASTSVSPETVRFVSSVVFLLDFRLTLPARTRSL